MSTNPIEATGLQELVEQDETRQKDLDEIVAGLSQPQKTLSPKFFYDERGSELFDEITRLPEYYPTATELDIMRDNIAEIADLIGREASLIEFGAGSNQKIRLLLEHLHEPAVYVPVDISRDFLQAEAEDLSVDFPHIQIIPVAADFTHPFDLPSPEIMPRRNIVYFPGSTIGNFTPDAALDLLKVMYQEAGEDGGLLIGVDLRKDRETLERAYNDSEGVTAEFNLNMLRHLNREFRADFDIENFRHRADYNEDAGRIEMYLISTTDQAFSVDGKTFTMSEGERILTELSHKYSLEGFAELAGRAGFEVGKVWTDAAGKFSVQYLLRD